MEASYSDEQIIKGIKTKDDNVFCYLYSKYKAIMIQFVVGNSGTLIEAEDFFQEAIIKVFLEIKKEDFKIVKSFDEYFTTICRNTWIRAVRIKKKQKTTNEFPEELMDLENYDEYRREQIQKLTMEQLSFLKEDCQNVIGMYYFQKKGMAEITYRMDYKNEQIAINKKYKCLEYLKEKVKNHPVYKRLKNE